MAAQVATEAVLVITSRVPVAEATLPQVRLGRLGPEPSTWLVQRTAPDLEEADVEGQVQLCKGVPLLLRLVADAFASGRVGSMRVRHGGAACYVWHVSSRGGVCVCVWRGWWEGAACGTMWCVCVGGIGDATPAWVGDGGAGSAACAPLLVVVLVAFSCSAGQPAFPWPAELE